MTRDAGFRVIPFFALALDKGHAPFNRAPNLRRVRTVHRKRKLGGPKKRGEPNKNAKLSAASSSTSQPRDHSVCFTLRAVQTPSASLSAGSSRCSGPPIQQTTHIDVS